MTGDELDLGHLNGFRVTPTDPDLMLEHRCGWATPLPPAGQYLVNIVVLASEHRNCTPTPPAAGSAYALWIGGPKSGLIEEIHGGEDSSG